MYIAIEDFYLTDVNHVEGGGGSESYSTLLCHKGAACTSLPNSHRSMCNMGQQVTVERNTMSLMISVFKGEGKTYLLGYIFFQFTVYLTNTLERFGMPTNW